MSDIKRKDEEPGESRREFLRRNSTLFMCGLAAAPLSTFLAACTKGPVSPSGGYEICPNTCTGCGRCVDVCDPAAIALPQRSRYAIDASKCVECGDCQAVCAPGAIAVAVRKYTLDAAQCVGCGKCVDVCRNEGGALSWVRERYTIGDSCHANQCGLQCIAACPEGAITRSRNKCALDPARCTRCGKCVPVCEYDAISGESSPGSAPPRIDSARCDACGLCPSKCSFGAITVERHVASVVQERCTGCGRCDEACAFDAVRRIP